MFKHLFAALLLLGGALAQSQAATPSVGDVITAKTATDQPIASVNAVAAPEAAEGSLRLPELLKSVTEAAPEMLRAQRLAQAQRLRAQTELAWPAPTASISYMGSAVPFRTMSMDPSSYRGFSLMQELPLGGRRELRTAIADKQADMMLLDVETARRELLRRASSAFAEYRLSTSAIKLTQESAQTLRQISRIAAERYGEGRGSLSEVSKAQIAETLLRQRILEFERMRAASAGVLNVLMGRGVDAPLAPPAVDDEPTAPERFAADASSIEGDTQIAAASLSRQKARLEEELARRDSAPEISVGYMMQQRSSMADMYGLQINITLPFWQKDKRRQMIAASRMEAESAEFAIAARRRELAQQLSQAIAAAEAARKGVALYSATLLPQCELAQKAAAAAYAEGGGALTDALTWTAQRYDYEIEIERMRAEHRKALAEIEFLTGDAPKESR